MVNRRISFMHLFPRFKDLRHEFLRVGMDAHAQRPIWCNLHQQELPRILGEANKELVLDTLWRTYRWREVREQIDESSQGEHMVMYWQQEAAPGVERRLLVSSGKALHIRQGGNVYNTPFFRHHLWDEDALIENESLQVEIGQFTGVQPERTRRIVDVVEALGPRIQEVIRFTVSPAVTREDRAECLFECAWRCHSSLHERGVDFVIAISETRSPVMRLYETLGEKLGRAVILPLATSMLLNRETGVAQETTLHLIATTPISQLAPSLSATGLAWVLDQWRRMRQRSA
jgi:hypothetical protein